MKKKIILAYSGGLDTSAIIPWLIHEHSADVIAYCCDLGNLPSAEALRKRALALGAAQFIFEDLKEEFVSNYVFPMIRAGATYQQEYLLGTAIARPIIAERIAKAAVELDASAIAHGATGKGNDQLRFERTWAFLVPKIEVIAPWKDWAFKSRQELVTYLGGHGYAYTGEVNPAYSVDENLFHRSCEGGFLEDIGKDFPAKEVYRLTKQHPIGAPKSETVTVSFEKGIPSGLDGQTLPASELLCRLNQIGGSYGIGVLDLVEERMTGIKSRGIYETPGGTILHFALRALKQACWDRTLHRVAGSLAQIYGDLIYDGMWHSLEREAVESFFLKAGSHLTGTVGLRISAGSIKITGRQSPKSLYDKALVSFEEDAIGLNAAAGGFCSFSKLGQLQAGLVKKREGSIYENA